MSVQHAKELSAQLSDLASAVEIVEIRPIGFLARLMRDAPQAGSRLDVEVKKKLEARREGDSAFVVYADFSLDVHPEADPKEEFLKLRYTIISRYRVPSGYRLEQEVVDFFASTNGMVHLWPYLRAFVANTCAQMGVLPITLPPFRVQALQQPEDESTPATANQGAPARA